LRQADGEIAAATAAEERVALALAEPWVLCAVAQLHVVFRTPLSIAEHCVCFRHALKACCGSRVPVLIRVHPSRYLQVCAADLVVGRAGVHAENGVVVGGLGDGLQSVVAVKAGLQPILEGVRHFRLTGSCVPADRTHLYTLVPATSELLHV
jgi:hypothetical protein